SWENSIMKTLLHAAAIVLAAAFASAQTIVVHPCETLTLQSNQFSLVIDDLIVEAGGTLRVAYGVGGEFHLRALRGIRVEGLIDFSGQDAHDVLVLPFSGLI